MIRWGFRYWRWMLWGRFTRCSNCIRLIDRNRPAHQILCACGTWNDI